MELWATAEIPAEFHIDTIDGTKKRVPDNNHGREKTIERIYLRI